MTRVSPGAASGRTRATRDVAITAGPLLRRIPTQASGNLLKNALAADAVLVAHFLFALFAVLGGFLVLLDWRVAIVHLPTVAWSSIVNLANWTCPLTPLESGLRARAGQKAFEGGWIRHYLDPLVRPLGMPRRMELIAGVSILAWNAVVYGVVWSLGRNW